jgi:hypothetical protein
MSRLTDYAIGLTIVLSHLIWIGFNELRASQA